MTRSRSREGWRADITRDIGAAVARTRKQRRLTGDDVVEALEDVGVAMTRAGLTNLEAGRREGVGVHEIYALAAVLGVPPIALLVPDLSAEIEILPGRPTDGARAAAWITGQYLPGAAELRGGEDVETFDEAGRPFDDLILHAQLARDVERAHRTLGGPAGQAVYATAVGALLDHRAAMADRGITDPPLPPALSYLESDEGPRDSTATTQKEHATDGE